MCGVRYHTDDDAPPDGCPKPGRFRNPVFDPDGLRFKFFGFFGYAEWLCAEHYDEVMDFKERWNEEVGSLERVPEDED
jgi:hypothetical protein